MSRFNAFFAQNAIQPELTDYVASSRFVNPETKKPEVWQLRAVDEQVNKKLKKDSMLKVNGNRPNVYRQEVDADTYMCKLIVASVVYPNLNDKELQDAYKVMDAEELIRKMLISGEYTNLSLKVQEVNNFDITQNSQIDEAKN